MIGNDPNAARQLLMNAVGASSGSSVDSEMSELGESATPMTAPSLPTPGTTATTESAPMAEAVGPAKTETAPSMESKPTGSPAELSTATVTTPTAPESVEMYKMLKSIADRLTAIETAQKPAPMAKAQTFPAGDLQALINATPADDEKLLKALRTGGNDAYAQALKIAGDPGKLTSTVNKAVMSSLNEIFASYQILP
jgi:cell division septation protein DedD